MPDLNNTGSLTVLYGTGFGTFGGGSCCLVGSGQAAAAVGDFNGDGIIDLAALDSGGSVSLLLGQGQGNFGPAVAFAPGSGTQTLLAGDLNDDGRLDMVTVSNYTQAATVLLQVDGPAAYLSPASLAFPVQLVGSVSAVQRVTLTNTGNGVLDISAVSENGAFLERNYCGSTLGVGKSCTISVSFKPMSAGAQSGAVTIVDNAPLSPQTITLSGTGTFFKINPTSLNFGAVPIGQTSAPQTVTLTNIAKISEGIAGIRIKGANGAEFAETNNCGSTLGAGASCAITVTFSPKRSGDANGLLQINGGGALQSLSLFGTGS